MEYYDLTKNGHIFVQPKIVDLLIGKYSTIRSNVTNVLLLLFYFLFFRESENETVRYYSSKPHLDDLIEFLESDGQERRLLSALKTKYSTIIKHMAITESLVEASRG